jgi:photosystem II stability/assembly factor-like uncharacterized protein
VYALAASGDNLFVGTGGGVFRSSDNGTSWRAAGSDLMNMIVTTLATRGSSLFAGTYGNGVFVSTDDGASWTAIGPTDGFVNVLAASSTSPFLFAGTAGSAVWRYRLF